MILQALYQLAQDENLMGSDPDYELKRVAWIVRVGEGGRLINIESTHYAVQQQTTGRKPKSKVIERAKYAWAPREPERTSGDYSFFLCDNSEYVFGIEPKSKKGVKRAEEKLAKRAQLFLEKVRECFTETHDEGVGAVLALLEDILRGRQGVELDEKCQSNDLFGFVYAPDRDRLVTDREAVRSYWHAKRAKEIQGDPMGRRCLVTGSLCIPIDKHPHLKQIPGGTPSGIALVSFNEDAFESFGWNRNTNAIVSRHAAEVCSTALNRLLNSAPPNPTQPETTLGVRNLRLSADTAVCFWSAQKNGDDFSSAFADLLTANRDEVKEVYRSIWRGKPPDIDDPSAFYALTLTGTQGRAIVRDWFETTVARVATNLSAHFADLAIVRTPPPKGKEHPPHFPLGLLCKSLADPARNRQESIPAPLTAQFLKAVFSGTIYPLAILQRALLRFRAEIGNEQDQKDGWETRQWNDARAALIKAVLNRRKRLSPQTTSYEEVQREMDPSHRSEGYTLGQLMAVIERLQQEALNPGALTENRINASVVDRYFGGASASPKSVFVRLLKNTRHHVRKARDNSGKGGLIFLLEKLLDELADQFDPKRNGFPAYLDLEQQGLFVLGYHQMRRWLWMNKEDRAEWEKSHPTAPSAYQWSKREPALS